MTKPAQRIRLLTLLMLLVPGVRGEPTTSGEREINAIVRDTFSPLFAAAASARAQQQPYEAGPLDEAMRAFLAERPEAPQGWDLFVAYSRFALGGTPARTEKELLESYSMFKHPTVEPVATPTLGL